MNIKGIIIISALVVTNSAVFSQGLLDAYKYSQTDLLGSARYLGMGGAFGALGGDISALNTNPAGLAVYRSSEIVSTLSLNSVSSKTNLSGSTGTGSRTRFNFDNIAYVGYFPTSHDAGVIGWNMGFSYNRLKDYHKSYYMKGTGSGTSFSDYLAERANASGYHKDDISYNLNDWQTVLGYEAGFIDAYSNDPYGYYSAFGDDAKGEWEDYTLAGRELTVQENGAIDQYNIAFGLNISDFLLLGADIAFTDIDYHYYSYYAEDFTNTNYLLLENRLNTEGSGYAFNVGAILRPVNFLRLGVAYNSPTWYKMTDGYSAMAESDSYYWDNKITRYAPPNDGSPDYFEYEFRSPDKWLFSAAAIIGQSALLSADYELTNYKNAKVYQRGGIEIEGTNNDIAASLGTAGTLRVGGEVKVTPQFAVRAGAAWIGNPMNDILKKAEAEVNTVGTIPHYTIEKSITNYTVGLGYRFTPSFYIDLACVLKSQKEDLFAYSKIFDNAGKELIESQSASLKTSSTRVALTLGYKF